MTLRISISSLIGKLTTCSVLLYTIYIFYGPPRNVELEMINMPLFLLIIPAILILSTIIVCFLLGLPIRMISSLREWWLSRPFVAFLILLTGLAILTLTWNSNFIDTQIILVNEEETIQETPNTYLLATGWLFTAFSLLHFYPKQFFEFLRSHLRKKKIV